MTSDWHAASDTLVVLAIADELSLGRLCEDATAALDEFGRSLTAAEYRAARARTADEQLRNRIEDPDAA